MRSAVSMPRPSRSNFTSPASAQSSLSHCSTVRPGIRAHSTGHTSMTGRSHMTMPPEWMPRCRGRRRNRSARSMTCSGISSRSLADGGRTVGTTSCPSAVTSPGVSTPFGARSTDGGSHVLPHIDACVRQRSSRAVTTEVGCSGTGPTWPACGRARTVPDALDGCLGRAAGPVRLPARRLPHRSID